jgi:hypothetical protein
MISSAKIRHRLAAFCLSPSLLAPLATAQNAPDKLTVKEGDRIVLLGAGMASRMEHFKHFETELYLRFPKADLTIRNMGD